MHHKIKVQPAVEPVTLAEIRGHLGVSQANDVARDSIITGRIISARQMCEAYTRRQFITQTWGGYTDIFPGQPALAIAAIIAPVKRNFTLRGDLQSINYIKYLDQYAVLQTLPANNYLVDTITGTVHPAFNVDWPTVQQQPNAVEIEYVCGYGSTAAAVPESIKDAIRFIVAQWEAFQGSIEGVVRPFTMPNAAKELLNPYVDNRGIF